MCSVRKQIQGFVELITVITNVAEKTLYHGRGKKLNAKFAAANNNGGNSGSSNNKFLTKCMHFNLITVVKVAENATH